MDQLFFFNCMFYQLLCVQHSCSSTQSWGSVLPSIVEMRNQNSRGCPLLFSNRNLGSFCAQGTEMLYTHSLWEVVDHSRSKMHETCLIIIHETGMRPGPGIEPGTFGLTDECSTYRDHDRPGPNSQPPSQTETTSNMHGPIMTLGTIKPSGDKEALYHTLIPVQLQLSYTL